ncbi:hypothetical protein V2G26_000687 [Clonostachys chloroleuca]
MRRVPGAGWGGADPAISGIPLYWPYRVVLVQMRKRLVLFLEGLSRISAAITIHWPGGLRRGDTQVSWGCAFFYHSFLT